jgi:hypothetical protein
METHMALSIGDHDVWDKDLPTPPALITVNHEWKKDRRGCPNNQEWMWYMFLKEKQVNQFSILQEMPVDTVTELMGEKLWPTQPIPKKAAAFARQTLTLNDINPYLPDTSIARLKNRTREVQFWKNVIFLRVKKLPLYCPVMEAVLNGAVLRLIRKQTYCT